ncbi:MAG: DUF3015 family protein [Proteobacteria bacterium]|nr:DUF3015 family protein [Pseudomonadota bacterium]
MKKTLACLAGAVFLFSGTAFADNRRNTGCGLGNLVLGDAAYSNTTLGQSFVATTNGSGSQTIGITLGTSNCEKPSTFVKNERLHEFVVANMDELAKDIAVGEGESLDTLAELMEITPDARAEAYAKLQSNFDKIYTSSSVTAAHVVDSISAVL